MIDFILVLLITLEDRDVTSWWSPLGLAELLA